MKDLTPGALLGEFASEVTRNEFDSIRREYSAAVTDSLNT